MLNVSSAMVAAAVKKYFDVSDFRVKGHTPPAIWGGELAKQLGLEGEVKKEHMDRLADGYHPFTGEDLVQNRLEDRRSANDITISAPKPVTLLYVRTKDPRILDAFVKSCDEIMSVMEEDAAARVRKGGADYDRITRNWAYSGHVHFEARPDKESQLSAPQLHRHHVTYNLTRDPVENEIKALQIGIAKGNADLYMPMFHNILAKRMRDLGYGIERTGKVGFGVKGVSRDLIDRFSPRRLTIVKAKEHAAKALGITDPERLRRLQAELGKLTRKHKQKDLTHEQLDRYWDAMLTPKDKSDLDNAKGQKGWATDDAKAMGYAISHLFEKHSVVPTKTLMIEALRYGVGSVTPGGLKEEARRQGVREGSILINGKWESGYCTTARVDAQEQEIRAFAREGRGACRPAEDGAGRKVHDFPSVATHPAKTDLATIFGSGQQKISGRTGGPLGVPNGKQAEARLGEPPNNTRIMAGMQQDTATISPEQQAKTCLTDEQAAAVRGLLSSPDRVNIVDAGQGTGKTTMLEAYGKALERLNVPTTWLGTTHTAVREMKERGVPAMTLASFLHSEQETQKARGSRIILDEASMLSHQDNYDLFKYAKENNCRIDLIGDSKQYKTPAAGDPLRLLTQHAGIKPIAMTKTMRQKGRLKGAMEDIREGKELKAHDTLKDLGMVHELPLDELAQKAADLYLAWTAKGDAVPVISPTHVQADEIAARIREGLRDRGEITGPDVTVRKLVNLGWSKAQIEDAKENGAEGVILTRYGAFREETQSLAAGDLVRTTRGGKTKDGHELNNGQRYSIKGFTKDNDPILNNGWVIDKDWGGLSQRYVSTGQGAQGVTAPRAVVVYGTPSLVATRHEGFYVPVSRVRREVAVLTDNDQALRGAIQRREARPLAAELVTKKPRRKKFMERAKEAYEKLRDRVLGVTREIKQPERMHDYGR